jgi:hypothetical protein
MSKDLIRDLSQCEREIAECAAYEGPDKMGALLGEVDARIEREYILQELKSEASGITA